MEKQYIPGVCNIGEKEISRRKQTGFAGLVIVFILLAAFLFFDIPKIWRLFIFIPATLAALGYIQAYTHFCAYFGFRSLFNFGEIGKAETIPQSEFRAKDRKRARRILIYSLIAGAIITLVICLLPI